MDGALIGPGTLTDIMGITILGLGLLYQLRQQKVLTVSNSPWR